MKRYFVEYERYLIVKVEEDSIRIYGLCKGCEVSVKVFGAGKVSKDEDVYIL